MSKACTTFLDEPPSGQPHSPAVARKTHERHPTPRATSWVETAWCWAYIQTNVGNEDLFGHPTAVPSWHISVSCLSLSWPHTRFGTGYFGRLRTTTTTHRKAWMPYFCRSWHLVVTVEQLLNFVDPFLPQKSVLDLPRITGQDLLEVARAKKSTAGGLDGWAWNEIKFSPLTWFSGLAIIINKVGTSAVWPQGLLDALYCHDSQG